MSWMLETTLIIAIMVLLCTAAVWMALLADARGRKIKNLEAQIKWLGAVDRLKLRGRIAELEKANRELWAASRQ